MATKVFLGSGDSFPIAAAADVFGASGTGVETVTLPGNPSGVVVDANVERIDFAGNAADYTYKLTGNEVAVSFNGAVVATINAGNNPKLAFADGSASITVTGLGAANLGGVSLTDTDAALAGTPTLDTAAAEISSVAAAAAATPTFSIAASAATVTENETATYTVTLSEAPVAGATATVDYAIGLGGGASTADHGDITVAGTVNNATSGTLTFAAGETTKTITTPITVDSATETGETIAVTLSNASTGTAVAAASTAEVTLADAPAATFSLTSDGATKNTEGDTVTFTVTPSGVVSADTTLTFSITGDTIGGAADAAVGADFNVASGNLSFLSGSSAAQTIAINLTANDGSESLEGYKFSLLGGTPIAPIADVTGSIIDGSSTGTGQTFSLTTSVDTLVGTASADKFVADNTGTNETSSTADTITGNGGIDTLEIFSDGTIGGLPQLSSIENVTIYDEDTDLDISTFSSVTTAGLVRGDGDIGLTLGVNATTVNLTEIGLNDSSTNNGVTITSEATVTSMTLGLNKIIVGADTNNEDVTINGTALTTVNVNTSGTASSFEVLDVDAATTVNINAGVALTLANSLDTTATAATLTITGAGLVDLGALDVGFTTVTASAATGGLTADIGTNDDTILTGSTGADTITASTTDALVTADKLAVDAGDGTDTLILGDANDVNTSADAARYTNFEILQTSASQVMNLISGITGLNIAATSGTTTFSQLTATQAANVKIIGDINAAGVAFSLADATGSSDVLTIVAGTDATTAGTAADVDSLTLNDIETLNISTLFGSAATAGGQRTAVVATLTSDDLTTINLTGAAFDLEDIATTKAVTINGSALTGDGATTSLGLTVAGSAVTGSTINGSAVGDRYTIGAEGSTYNGAAGDDTFTTTVSLLNADGSTDLVVDGGDDTDTLIVSDTAPTLTDVHFTNVSNMEKLTFSTTTDSISLTTGGSFKSAFSSGVTVTVADLEDAKSFSFIGGLYDKAATINITSNLVGEDAGEDINITTGSAADIISITADSWTGAAGAGSSIVIDTRAGDDTITITSDQLLANTTDEYATITGGTGADTITLDTTRNGDGATAKATFVIVDGDSLEASRDKITGFEMGDGTNFSDVLDFDTGAVGTLSTSTDTGVILSHSITNGVATFDDAAAHANALTINSSNLSDVLLYLEANANANGVIAFEYDSTGDGANDATMVFHNDTNNSLVELVGLTGGTSIATTNTTANLIAIGS